MSAIVSIGMVWLGASIVMIGGWLYQRRTQNAGIVDVLWSLCMAAAALFYALTGSGALMPRVLVGSLGAIWGLRLAAHLWIRVSREDEDGRYAHLRKRWNGNQVKFLMFFLAQGLFTAIFSLPFWIAAHNPVDGVTVWAILAVLTWVVALGGEWIADNQLAAHRTDPAM
ncbi:MAG: DUF1295 domain-containing protein, partial [Dokdonella sp.]